MTQLQLELDSLVQQEGSLCKQLDQREMQRSQIANNTSITIPSKCYLPCRDGMAQLQLKLESLVQQEGSLRKQLDQKEQRLLALDDNLQQLKQQ